MPSQLITTAEKVVVIFPGLLNTPKEGVFYPPPNSFDFTLEA